MKKTAKSGKTLVAFIAILILHLPLACNDGCEDTDSLVTVTALEADLVALDNRTILDRDSTTLDSAILVVAITDREVENTTLSGFTGLSSAAVAEDCAFRSQLKHTLESITITSSEAIEVDGVSYEAGADLTNIFSATHHYWLNNRYSVDELLDFLAEDSFWFTSIGESFYFQFNGTPSADVRQSFTFVFQFSDRSITVSSGEVVILVP